MRMWMAALALSMLLPAFASAGVTNSLMDVSPDGK